MGIIILLLFIGQLFSSGDPISLASNGVAVLIFAALLFAYWRGWEYARHTVVIITTLLVVFTQQEPYVSQRLSLSILISPVLALIMTSPAWVVGSAIITVAGLVIRAGGVGPYADPQTIALYVMIIGGMILARLVTDTAQRKAEENARHAQQERARAEAQARELAEANELMNEQLDQQSKLLDLVNTLETPVVPLANGMLLAPIIGHVDTRRAQALTTRLLHEASAQRAKLVVLDIAGVSVMDTSVAKALVHTVHALRLLGCEVTLSGISASVAMSLIQLGVNLDEVRTVRSPQEALANYLSSAKPTAQRAEAQPLKKITTPLNTNGSGQVSRN
jgi:anti-anti-sigma regulatory factor